MSEVPDAPQPTASPEHQAKSAFAAFRHPAFLVIWMATVVANIGSWMYSAASGWLMTSLHGDALSVALVQVASSLPIFLFAIPAGALADILDKRRFLIVGETAYTLISAGFAVLVWRGLVTPSVLLAFTFPIGAAGAVTAPAWQAIVPLLVPQRDLQTGVAANSVGVNVSRAIGPAFGGAIIPGFGISAPFWINAISDVAVILALVWWRPPLRDPSCLLPERLGGAICVGLRNAWHNSFLRSTLVRTVAFFPFASAYWALLPLVARNQVAGGSELLWLAARDNRRGSDRRHLRPALAEDPAWPRPIGRRRNAWYCDRAGAVWFGPDNARGAGGECAGGRFLDRRPLSAECLGPGRPAGLGASKRSGGVRHHHVRGDNPGQRGLGTARGRLRPASIALPRGCGRGPRYSSDLALEATDGRWR